MKLPKGVVIHIGGQCYRGEIPDDKCPKRFAEKVNDAKSKGTSRKSSSDNS